MSEVDDLGGLAPEDEWLRPHVEADLTPAAPEPGTQTREALAAAARSHQLGEPGAGCLCGWIWDDADEAQARDQHAAHLAAALAPEVARIEREAREDERARIHAEGIERNLAVLKHEAETDARGHDEDGACCRAARIAGGAS